MTEYQKIEDQWLVLKFQSGDKEALDILVKKWHVKLIYYSFGIVKDMEAAKDVVQDSWTTIVYKLNSLKDPQCFQFWANSIVHNKSVDWIRKQQRQRKEENKLAMESGFIEDDSIIDDREGQMRLMIHGLSALKDNEKLILTLFYLREQSICEISKILKIPIGTVKSRLFTAREHLKNSIKT